MDENSYLQCLRSLTKARRFHDCDTLLNDLNESGKKFDSQELGEATLRYYCESDPTYALENYKSLPKLTSRGSSKSTVL